jgi:hypothetical protein
MDGIWKGPLREGVEQLILKFPDPKEKVEPGKATTKFVILLIPSDLHPGYCMIRTKRLDFSY